MITDDDIEAATEKGILSPVQADALRSLAAKRLESSSGLLAHEERFRFMRGFNDFFFAIGIVLLCAGMGYFAGTASMLRLASNSALTIGAVPNNVAGAVALANAFAAAIVWVLAELLVKRMRLVLPGILLASFFVLFSFSAIPFELLISPPSPASPETWGDILARTSATANSLTIFKALTAAAAAAMFYERFRLPFALLLMAGALVVVATSMLNFLDPGHHAVVLPAALLACGLAIFVAAMRFDMSDRERVTRQADCAFWLHLLAAPLIVHSLITLVAAERFAIDANTALVIFGVVVVLALVSIAIDRRALFVSALAYLGVVIGFAVTQTAGHQLAYRYGDGKTVTFFATLLILGAVVVALGVGWMPLRRGLLATLPATLTDRFPSLPVKS